MTKNGALKILPVTWEECTDIGWDYLDVLLVTGDAYIDHPSFGIGIIGRLLESQGFRVAILSQPRFDSPVDFKSFPAPRLFCGISGGNLDSIVANYSGNGKVREDDAYSPYGDPWRDKNHSKLNRRRPDRASIIYANLARSVYKNTPIVLGGVEASLRRFVHFDYKQNRLRGSILTDAKGDVLIFGMGEKAITKTAHQLSKQQETIGIEGTCLRMSDKELEETFPNFNSLESEFTILPSWDEIASDSTLFLKAETLIDSHARTKKQTILLQKQQSSWVIQFPPPSPLSSKEMDTIYSLPFSRESHPTFKKVPAYEMIKDSITIVRGCSGNCSFCAITRHQGPVITSRSIDSIVKEATQITKNPSFNGVISDLGGPTANLWGTKCGADSCRRHDCLFPRVCPQLVIDETSFLKLLEQVSGIEKIKHVFISSGLRMELLRKAPKLMQQIIKSHTPGALKIAPEHTEKDVLKLMHKEPFEEIEKFINEARRMAKGLGKKIEINPYIISAHPGCNEEHTRKMVTKLKDLGLVIRGFQDFTPTPGTLSTAMYYTEVNKDTSKRLYVAKDVTARRKQRKLLEDEFFKKTRTSKNPAQNKSRSKKKRR